MFAQVNTKSVYSFLESTIDLETYVERAKSLGYQQIGIMDKDNLYAAFRFYQLAQAKGLTAIIGLETHLQVKDQQLPLYLIAVTTKGYHHLLKLSTLAMSTGIQLQDLIDNQAGLEIIFPHSHMAFLEDFPFDYSIGVNPTTPHFQTDRPLFPLKTVRQFAEKDRETLQVLSAIRENVLLKDVAIPSQDESFEDRATVEALFAQRFPQALAHMEAVLKHVSYDFSTELKLPRFNRSQPADEQLRQEVEAGLKAKNLWTSSYIKRMTLELETIHSMGFDDYFLIVWDILAFGRRQGYYMGMGRGSAAGSLVAFALDITGIDPIANGLLFERFLNKERYSMPDIDIDMPDRHRSDFLRYVQNRYGNGHVAQIVTFSTFGAKQAIRDVFKRFGARDFELSELTKRIGFKDRLSDVYANNINFRQLITTKPAFEKAFAIALALEGKPRQTSIHAAGIVMSDAPLTQYIPLKAGEDMMVTQYDAPAVEANGLLKMDFLGLRNLTYLQLMQESLVAAGGPAIDIAAINLEDKPTLDLFASGNTKGIFQFEATGAINLLRRIKPQHFEEIVATTSLNRPGASDYLENFIRRKNGQEAIDLVDPSVASILEPTYGIMLYQEQVMQIAQVFAGFSLGKADLLRRAMSKKDGQKMQEMEADFLLGAQTLGRDPNKAQRLFKMMAKFAGYGFNRSHAYAYSALAFQLAYFKAHYPAVFYAVMLNETSGDYVSDALANGFQLQKLSLNRVSYYDKIADKTISLGLRRVHGISNALAVWIIDHRPFSNLEDFITRLPDEFLKLDDLQALGDLGLFDEFNANRQQVVRNLPGLVDYAKGLSTLFGEDNYSWRPSEDYSPTEKFNRERELIGHGLSPHPVQEAQKKAGQATIPLGQLSPQMTATVLGELTQMRVIRTKSKGEQMAFLTVTDGQFDLEITVFPEVYRRFSAYLKEERLFYLTGKTQERNDKLQLVLQDLRPYSDKKLWLKLADHSHDQTLVRLFQSYPGPYSVVLHYEDSKETIESSRYFVSDEEEFLEKLAQVAVKTVFH
ncbi:DNA polymerase III subunit alpha [Streptococcus sp. DD12]|uniref:DNA polymerase III subunit alpha n=1 Tax=Streptococcus sp. DD12 TaxID=1777880 RepID=UPI00079AEDC6|nr:DNA polymerase III subunit alpha [Streptococcus sp. DD12]KXT76739.1 DNA polymerase III alpha subunit [Streptococcus sp. DD12]